MSTATKTLRSIQASATNTATSTTNSTTWDARTAYGGLVSGYITNGGTGPTIGCDFNIQVSTDGTNWRDYVRSTAGLTASAIYYFGFEFGPSVMYARVQFVGNTGQSVTIFAEVHEFTSP